MTQLLELAIDAARQLSLEEQDELARTILEIVHGTGEDVYVLSDEENAAIDVTLAQLERGEFFTKEDVAAVFSKYREK